MISEREFSVQWRKLFVDAPAVDDNACAKAEELIDALPETSPLRQRYGKELSDLQELRSKAAAPPAKPRRTRARS